MFYRSESLKSSRQAVSNSLLLCFILAILMAGAFSEFFQTPEQADSDLQPWRKLFTPRQLAHQREVELTNKLGTFRFKKWEESGRVGWNMIHPRQLNADDNTIAKILDGIQQINVLKIYPQDPINLSHYSLDNPATVLKLTDADNKVLVLKTGLVNTIDNSTYMTISGKEPLFHVEKLNFPMESLSLANFIDPTIFTLAPEETVQIQIRRSSRLNLSARLEKGLWLGRRGRAFDTNKIETFFKKMFALKSRLILDETSQALKKKIDRYTSRTLYTVTIRDKQESSHTYKISHPLPKLADVKIERGETSLVTSSDDAHPRLMDKEHLEVFNIRESQLYP